MSASSRIIAVFATFALAFALPLPNKSASTGAMASDDPSGSTDDSHHCRSLEEIIWGCATTVILCTWVSFHPELPNPRYTHLRVAITQLISVCISFIIPELVVIKAVKQWAEVHRYKSPFDSWAITHSFFTIMGGFVDRDRILEFDSEVFRTKPDDLPPGLLGRPNPSPDGVAQLDADNDSPVLGTILISKADILDKSKSGSVAKFLTVAQTTWFILQFAERWAARQTRTQLEVMTVAYAILNIFIYALWRNKPLNVNEPIEVSGRRNLVSPRGHKIGFWKSDKNIFAEAFWSLLNDHGARFGPQMVAGTAVTIATLFGGVHCFAWYFHFPTEEEQILWRLCTVYCTASPVFLWLFGFLRSLELDVSLIDSEVLFGGLVLILLLGYIVSRTTLLVLTFACLRAEPPSIYDTTKWTKF